MLEQWCIGKQKPARNLKKKKVKATRKASERVIKLTTIQQEVYEDIHSRGFTITQVAAKRECTGENVRQHLEKAENKIKAMNRTRSVRKKQDLPHDRKGQVMVEALGGLSDID